MKLVENLSKEKPTFQIISFFLLDIFRNSIHLRDKLCEGKTVKCSHSNGHITWEWFDQFCDKNWLQRENIMEKHTNLMFHIISTF